MNWYYTCNNKNINFKIEAVKESVATGNPILYHTPYKDFDFSKQNNATWQELLKQEAISIRDRYKKVRLWYSGGSDSQVILDTFIKNNIPIDEIVYVSSGIKQADFEIEQYVLPKLKAIKNQIPNTKIRNINHTIDEYKNFYSDENWVSNFLKFKPTVMYFHIRFTVTNLINEETIDSDYINVHGKDKPRLKYIDGQWYTYFFDSDVEDSPNQYNFYIDNPELHSKQCHMLRESIEQNMSVDDYNLITEYDMYQDFWNKHSGRYLYTKNVPMKVFDPAQINGLNYINNKEHEALKYLSKHYPEIVANWQRGINKLGKQYEEWFNKGRPELGTIGCLSKFYSLTQNTSKTVDQLYPNGYKPY
jgi:hypothetical protein|tara:strand:- start:217 stop:1299 length:1083 start_codon:yes stop_codon:yes gene_type:complete